MRKKYSNRSKNSMAALKKTQTQPKAVTSRDAFQNVLARIGLDMPNLLEGTNYPMTRLSRDFNLMNSLYRSHWIIRRIVDTIPEDMCKNWIKINSQIDPQALKKYAAEERRIKLIPRILQGLRWGRLYGGAIGVMLIKGQGDDLSKPLDMDVLMPGDFKGIMILDRWNGCYPSLELETDISDPEFDMPKYYNVSDPETQINVQIHHSRIVRFEGLELPYWEKLSEQYWGASIIEVVFDEVKKRDNVSWNIAQLTFQANIKAMKMNDLGQLLATGDIESQKELYNVMSSQNMLMSNAGLMIMDKEDDMVNFQYTFGGIAEMYQQYIMDVSGAAEIPVTKLFGRSPAGLNATGESDMQNYDNKIEKEQESVLRPIIEKIMPVMAMSVWGAIPDDLDFDFNPVRTISSDKLADLAAKKSTAIIDAYAGGIISLKIALKELRQLADETGMWTNITDEDIEAADTLPMTPDELEAYKPQPGIAAGEEI